MLSRTCSFGSGIMVQVLMPFLIMPSWRQPPKPIICESCSEISAAWRRIAKEFPMMENATTNIYISSVRGASVCAFKRLVHLPFSVFEMRTSASQAQQFFFSLRHFRWGVAIIWKISILTPACTHANLPVSVHYNIQHRA